MPEVREGTFLRGFDSAERRALPTWGFGLTDYLDLNRMRMAINLHHNVLALAVREAAVEIYGTN